VVQPVVQLSQLITQLLETKVASLPLKEEMEAQVDHHQTQDHLEAAEAVALTQMPVQTQVSDKVEPVALDQQFLYQDHQLLTLEAAEEQLNFLEEMVLADLEAVAQVGHQEDLERQIPAVEAEVDLTQELPLIQAAEPVDQVLLS
jgi:hypothetical protein